MSHPESPSHEARRTLRRWKALALLLAGGLVVLGWLCASLLRTIEADEVRLVDRAVPAFTGLRQMSTAALSAQRALLGGWLASETESRERSLDQAKERLADGRRRLAALGALALLRDSPVFAGRLARTGDRYFAAADDLLAELRAGRWEQAAHLRQERVKPALDEFLVQIERAAHYAEDSTLNPHAADHRTEVMMGIAGVSATGFVLLLATVGAVLLGGLILLARSSPESGS